MKRLFAILGAISITLAGLTPAATAAQYDVYQKTLSPYVGAVTSLSAQQKLQVKQAVDANPLAEKFICTGIRFESAPMSENLTVRKRAKAACDYAKTLNPNLSTWFQNKPTKARSYAGKVLLTVKSPAEAVVSPAGVSIIDQVPKAKTLSALGMHVKAIELSASKLRPIELEYTIGPTVDPKKAKLVTDRFAQKLRMYQLVGLEKLDMDWVFASEKDYEWWRDYRSKQNARYPLDLWNPETNELGHCRLSSDIFCGAGNGVDGVNYQDNVIGTRFIDRGLDYVTRHESAHFYQAVFGYGGRCWFAEGQATFFETYLESSSRSRAQVIGGLRSSRTKVAESSKSTFETLLANNRICDGDSNIAYDLGMLAMEYLYLNYSFQEVHDLQSRSSTQSWDSVVRDVLKIEPSQLLKEMADYIYLQLN